MEDEVFCKGCVDKENINCLKINEPPRFSTVSSMKFKLHCEKCIDFWQKTQSEE